MIKIAFFVEGQTERIFVEKLLGEYLTYPKYTIEAKKLLGEKSINIITRRNISPEIKYYFLIYDIGGGEKVVSTLLERAEKMINQLKYCRLLALKDLHPEKRENKEKIINLVNDKFNEKSFKNHLGFVLAIMEVESWFLADYNLFHRINNILSPNYIKNKLNIDLIKDDPELYENPAVKVGKILSLVDIKYKKREKQSYNICHNIDYAFLCFSEETNNKISSFKYFIKCIDESLNYS